MEPTISPALPAIFIWPNLNLSRWAAKSSWLTTIRSPLTSISPTALTISLPLMTICRR
jgi:hypothetical protein